MALYIAFEGGEGSGKSTQARLLAERLDAVITREPGGTPLGARLRELLLNTDDVGIGARAEALMMAADRAQHIDEVVRPTLAAGRHVVADRSAFSSMAYQGGGRELGIEAVGRLSDWAIDTQWPDVVVMLRVDDDRVQVARAECVRWPTGNGRWIEYAAADQPELTGPFGDKHAAISR